MKLAFERLRAPTRSLATWCLAGGWTTVVLLSSAPVVAQSDVPAAQARLPCPPSVTPPEPDKVGQLDSADGLGGATTLRSDGTSSLAGGFFTARFTGTQLPDAQGMEAVVAYDGGPVSKADCGRYQISIRIFGRVLCGWRSIAPTAGPVQVASWRRATGSGSTRRPAQCAVTYSVPVDPTAYAELEVQGIVLYAGEDGMSFEDMPVAITVSWTR
jgi:hypothetical protein